MEIAPVDALFAEPRHPYTRMLLGSMLRADRTVQLPEADATPAEMVTYRIGGCRFAPRCQMALSHCWEVRPPQEKAAPDHFVMCHNWRVAG